MERMYPFVRPVMWFISSAFIMTALYWSIVRFVAIYCAPSGLYGLFSSAFTIGSPFCQALTQLMVKISDYYLILWTSVTTAFATWIISILYIKQSGK
jgi:hypothetical protein